MSDQHLDRVIDDVARTMTEGALPNDFRARVIARIEDGGVRGSRFAVRRWMLVPMAAAAIIFAAIFLARPKDAGQQVRLKPDTTDVQLPAGIQRRSGELAQSTRLATPRLATSRLTTSRLSTFDSDVVALAPPPLESPSIAVGTLRTDSLALENLETPAPIAIAPLATPEGERQ